jgi:hypothetical protein
MSANCTIGAEARILDVPRWPGTMISMKIEDVSLAVIRYRELRIPQTIHFAFFQIYGEKSKPGK